MDPAQQSPRRRNAEQVKVPAIVVFQWGTILFEGYIDTYRERVEFFSDNGVPLRAVVTLSLTQQQRSFSPPARKKGGQGGSSNADLRPGANEPVRRLGTQENMTNTATSLGDADAAKTLAAQNGVENMRHPEVGELVVNARAGGLAATASATASASAGFNAGADLSASFGETGAQFSGLKTGLSLSAGATARAGLSLEVGGGAQLDLSLKGAAGFGLGGQAGASAGASLTADVGCNADIELGIQFEE